MMTNKGDNERRVQCPYDPSHQILHYRFQTHLVKCKRNFMEKNPNAKMAECMYNAVHQVPEPELAYHHDHCVDRIRLDRYVYVPETVDQNKFPVPQLNLQSEENWDGDVVPVYNPEDHCVNNPILRNKCTLSAAKRRDFRFEERQRMQKLHSEKEQAEKEPEVPMELRQPQEPVPTQRRRPVTLSAGLKDTRDVTALLEQVKLGPQTVTVPKLAAPGGVRLANRNETENNTNIPNDNETTATEYPPLGRAPGGVRLINSNKMESNANIPNGNGTTATEYPPLGKGAIPKRKPADEERKVQCPYDEVHWILHYRFQTHLVKCSKTFKEKNPNKKMVDCIYNATHQIPEPKISYHLEHCPDRIRLDKFMYIPETVDMNKYPIPQLNLESEENWDDECVPIYNPEEYCVNKPVLRCKTTLSLAKRRNFRFEERQMMEKLLKLPSKEEPKKLKVYQKEEKMRLSRMPTTQVLRAPMSFSAGFISEPEAPDISTLLEKLKLRSKTEIVLDPSK